MVYSPAPPIHSFPPRGSIKLLPPILINNDHLLPHGPCRPMRSRRMPRVDVTHATTPPPMEIIIAIPIPPHVIQLLLSTPTSADSIHSSRSPRVNISIGAPRGSPSISARVDVIVPAPGTHDASPRRIVRILMMANHFAARGAANYR